VIDRQGVVVKRCIKVANVHFMTSGLANLNDQMLWLSA
jgi:hypothetical protein